MFATRGHELGILANYLGHLEPGSRCALGKPMPLAVGRIANMSIKQIKLSSQAKDQLIRLKTKTGISQMEYLVLMTATARSTQTS
jgi:hypothetical protein